MAASNARSQSDASLDFFRDSAKALSGRLPVAYNKTDHGYKQVDITGWDAYEVVGLLNSIVNRDDYPETSKFEFKIKSENKESRPQLFRLEPRPTDKQPGNGRIIYVDSSSTPEKEEGHKHSRLFRFLKEKYDQDTQGFAQDIKKVFKNNKEIFRVSKGTASTYMILLFEIGRRLKKDSTSPLDELPIGSAIVRIVKLLEGEKCRFEDVFLEEGKFYCFAGDCDKRQKAIDEINRAYETEGLSSMFCKDEINRRFKDLSLTNKKK